MGAIVSKDPIEPPRSHSLESVAVEVKIVSASRFYCYIQQFFIWPDYLTLFDGRSREEYKKLRITNAKEAGLATGDLSWAAEMVVLIYGKNENDSFLSSFIRSLLDAESPPKAIYILEGGFKPFMKRYPFLSNTSNMSGSLPGPVELIPPTKSHPAVYAIHRVHFLRARAILAKLKCTVVLNISSRRLFVKSPGITLENMEMKDNPAPSDYAITAFRKFVTDRKVKGSILIIDEVGCDYASLLAGFHLMKDRKVSESDALESVSNRIGFLDNFYTDILTEWNKSG